MTTGTLSLKFRFFTKAFVLITQMTYLVLKLALMPAVIQLTKL
jgi:hypothetical protein